MWHTLELTDLVRKLKSNLLYGITEEEAKERIEKYGKNVIDDKKRESIFIKFIKQFNDIMIIILIISSIVSAVVTKIEGVRRLFGFYNYPRNSCYECYHGHCSRSKSWKIYWWT